MACRFFTSLYLLGNGKFSPVVNCTLHYVLYVLTVLYVLCTIVVSKQGTQDMELRINGKALSDRQYLIWKLEKKIWLRNGRKLNRLSTKQIKAKILQLQRAESKQRTEYVKWLHSPLRQQHLIRFTAAHNISLLNKLHLVEVAA